MTHQIIKDQLQAKALSQLKNEAQIHQLAAHPNVIRLFRTWEQVDSIYHLLEYAENGSCVYYISSLRGLPAHLAMRFFRQAVLAVEYLHSKGIIHRDLKPENLLLDRNFEIKLCDFGFAFVQAWGSSHKSVVGTLEYIAPEIVEREKQTDKVDIWALGILLFELITGEVTREPPVRN